MKKVLSGLLLFICCVLSFAVSGAAPRVSILGDSYSTFKGTSPAGNAIWYPNIHADVQKVEECWWHLVIRAIGGKLEKNESWSGSTICNTGYHKRDASKFSFVNRVDRLGSPTLILICGATNDSWAGSPIGEYKWENWTAQDLYSFRPAMAKMLSDIKKLYQIGRAHV